MNYGTKLTPELQAQILASLSAGAFLADAFRAAGIPDRAWKRWMDPTIVRGPYYAFQNKVKQRQAICRVLAAKAVKEADAYKWCANGPGRDQPGEPGWAAVTAPCEPLSAQNVDPLQFPEFLRFVNNVRLVMYHFPEAAKMLNELNNQVPGPIPIN